MLEPELAKAVLRFLNLPQPLEQFENLEEVGPDVGHKQAIDLRQGNHLPLRTNQFLDVLGGGRRVGPLERDDNRQQLVLAPFRQFFGSDLRNQVWGRRIVEIPHHQKPVAENQHKALPQQVTIQNIERFGNGVFAVVVIIERSGRHLIHIQRQPGGLREQLQHLIPGSELELERHPHISRVDHLLFGGGLIGGGLFTRLAGSAPRRKIGHGRSPRLTFHLAAIAATGGGLFGSPRSAPAGRLRSRGAPVGLELGAQLGVPVLLLVGSQHGFQSRIPLFAKFLAFFRRAQETELLLLGPEIILDFLQLGFLVVGQLEIVGHFVAGKGRSPERLQENLPVAGVLGTGQHFVDLFLGLLPQFLLFLPHFFHAGLEFIGAAHALKESPQVAAFFFERLGGVFELRFLRIGQVEFGPDIVPSQQVEHPDFAEAPAAPPAAAESPPESTRRPAAESTRRPAAKSTRRPAFPLGSTGVLGLTLPSLPSVAVISLKIRTGRPQVGHLPKQGQTPHQAEPQHPR